MLKNQFKYELNYFRFTDREHEGRFGQSTSSVLPAYDADVARGPKTLPRFRQAYTSR